MVKIFNGKKYTLTVGRRLNGGGICLYFVVRVGGGRRLPILAFFRIKSPKFAGI
jgi:hypothetical protein